MTKVLILIALVLMVFVGAAGLSHLLVGELSRNVVIYSILAYLVTENMAGLVLSWDEEPEE